MKILVTGCAGMIGSYLTSHLLNLFSKKDGNRIFGIDNLSRGKLSNLKEHAGIILKTLFSLMLTYLILMILGQIILKILM